MSVRSTATLSSAPQPFQEFRPIISRIADQLDHHTAALYKMLPGDLDPSSTKMRDLKKAMFSVDKNVKMLAINAASCTHLTPQDKAGLDDIIRRLKNRAQEVAALRDLRMRELTAELPVLHTDPRLQMHVRMPVIVRDALASFIVPVDYSAKINAIHASLREARETAEKSVSEDTNTLERLERERSGKHNKFSGFSVEEQRNTVRNGIRNTGINLQHFLQQAIERLSVLEREKEAAERLRHRQIAESQKKLDEQLSTRRLLLKNEQLLEENCRAIEQLEATLIRRKDEHGRRVSGLLDVIRGADDKIDELEQTYKAESAAITIKRLEALAAVGKANPDGKRASEGSSKTQETIRKITQDSNKKLQTLTERHHAIVDRCQDMRTQAEKDFQDIEQSFVDESIGLEAEIAELRDKNDKLQRLNAELREMRAAAAHESERGPPLPPYPGARISGASVSLSSSPLTSQAH